MKRLLHISLLLCLLLTSCKLETSHNGDLDGYWKLRSVDSLLTGGVCQLTDSSLFWSVEKDLLMVNDNNDSLGKRYVMRFHQTDSTLLLSEAQLYNKQTGNEPVEDVSVLHKYGISTMPELFEIDHLTSRRMSLRSELLRLNFQKF